MVTASTDDGRHASNMISVVVPVYNGGESFRQCLSALATADPRPGEIIVVNDGGTDDMTYARETVRARVIELDDNGGPARARNRGAAAATGDVVLFLDADVVAPPEVVSTVDGVFKRQPELSALIGSYDDEPAEVNFLSQYRNLLHHYVHQHAKTDAVTFWAGCGAIRRVDFEQAGGFDEARYPLPSIEDIDLGIRLSRAGKRIRLVKELQVRHLKKWTAGSMLRTDFYRRAIPWSELIIREGGFVNDLNTSVTNRMSVALLCMSTAFAVAAAMAPSLLVAAAVCIALAIGLNAPLYLFYARKRGVLFALGAIPWHLLLLLQSGAAFLLVVIRSVFRRGGEATRHAGDTRSSPRPT